MQQACYQLHVSGLSFRSKLVLVSVTLRGSCLVVPVAQQQDDGRTGLYPDTRSSQSYMLRSQ